MSVTLDPSVQSSTAASNPGYWDDPATQGPVDTTDARQDLSVDAPVPVTAPDAPAAGDAIGIDGSDAGTRLPSGKTPDGKEIQTGQLHAGGEVDITRERTISDGYYVSDQVVLTTGNGSDTVGVTQRDDGTLDVEVNGERYEMRLGQGQELTIRSGDGNDTISVASNVKVNIVVDSGAGDDGITTGAGDDRIDGGIGDDTITTGAGRDDLFGNSGNDRLTAGDGDDVVHGGDGDDVMLGEGGVDFLEGGKGKDQLEGGAGQDMLSGGLDDDTITGGAGNDRAYTGGGANTVNGDAGDVVYAQTVSDIIHFVGNAKPTVVNIEISAAEGVTIEGSDAFRQRVGAEIEFLRSSPNGQQMLAEFDAAAAQNNTVTIRELANEQNGYAQTLGRANSEISNGKAGTGSDVIISYNPSFHMAEFPAPVVVLYHEMSHAYNGVNGTFQPGTFRGAGPDNGQVPNAERQAVGLETSAAPFDFDGNPDTPATTANPDHLTENGIREELGLPDRPSYAL
jgi:hypothetical protein